MPQHEKKLHLQARATRHKSLTAIQWASASAAFQVISMFTKAVLCVLSER